MPQIITPLSVAVTGTASSANLVAGSTGKSTRIWQLVISGTAADSTVSLVWKVGGTTTTMPCAIGTAGLILPYTGCPWMSADVATNITFTAAATTVVTAYYTQGIGG